MEFRDTQFTGVFAMTSEIYLKIISCNINIMNTQLHVLTFVTHSEGTYDELLDDMDNNDVTLNKLGWGKKWINYIDKLENVKKKIREYSLNDVVIVIDAFDTRMTPGHNEREILNIYKEEFGGSGVVFSKDKILGPPILPKEMAKHVAMYFNSRVFNGGDINAGMYIGRVEDLIPLLDAATEVTKECGGDDQCAFNKLRHLYHIKTDDNFKLFENVEYENRENHIDGNKSVFLGYPGSLTYSRLYRGLWDYLPFFWREILILTILVFLIKLKSIRKIKFPRLKMKIPKFKFRNKIYRK